MTGTWRAVGPGRSVYRPGGAGDWKIPADALLPYVNQVGLDVVERIRDRWSREVWPRIDAAYERAQGVRAAGDGAGMGDALSDPDPCRVAVELARLAAAGLQVKRTEMVLRVAAEVRHRLAVEAEMLVGWRARAIDLLCCLEQAAEHSERPDDVDRAHRAIMDLAGLWLSVEDVERVYLGADDGGS